MCTGRNCCGFHTSHHDSLAALDMCTGRNVAESRHPDVIQSSGLGYVHWPEQYELSHLLPHESSGLGYVHWPELDENTAISVY